MDPTTIGIVNKQAMNSSILPNQYTSNASIYVGRTVTVKTYKAMGINIANGRRVKTPTEPPKKATA